MKPGQKLVQDDLQVALYPMTHLRITQGRNGGFSHKGLNAYDIAGKDGNKDRWYAPFDIEVLWLDPVTKTGVVVTNTKRVLQANGYIAEPRTLLIMLWHDNWIGGLRVGNKFNQGDYFYEEGTAGNATGNHIHEEIAVGKFDGYPLYEITKGSGRWKLKGRELDIEGLYFINDTTVLDAKGYAFKKYTGKTLGYDIQPSGSFLFDNDIDIKVRNGKVGIKGKDTGLRYKRGQKLNRYDGVYEQDGHLWITYISASGVRRSIAVGKDGKLWGKNV